MRDPRGSLWWKWDLHVHTPASLVQNYGGDREEVWERFFADLESLPPEFKVIGINDYIFLDGYRRVLAARSQGRLANLDLILPVIELRVDRFAGTDGPLRRVNFHAIFSDKLAVEVIEQQFLAALAPRYRLSPEHTEITWQAVPTVGSLTNLGEQIIASAPPERRHQYGSPLFEGFASMTLPLEGIREALDRPFFRDSVLTAVGKSEWASIRWQDGAIADKKSLINGVDFVFTAGASPEACLNARASLARSGVNARLLDCSDAHDFSSAAIKDRIGHCYTWINADTEFEGLRQARLEAEERVFLGVEPDIIGRRRRGPNKYIDRIQIRKTGTALPEPWFDGLDLPAL